MKGPTAYSENAGSYTENYSLKTIFFIQTARILFLVSSDVKINDQQKRFASLSKTPSPFLLLFSVFFPPCKFKETSEGIPFKDISNNCCHELIFDKGGNRSTWRKA